MRTILVDADGVIWRFASIGEQSFIWDDQTTSYDVAISESEVKTKALEHIEWLLKACSANQALLLFSDWNKRNFRFEIEPTYRNNRKSAHKPPWINVVREVLTEAFPTMVKQRLEADDAIGIEATLAAKEGRDVVVVSRDKDLRQVPGTHWDHKTSKLVEVNETEADRFFFYQMLVGDPADGYKGCPGIGPKKANAALNAVSPFGYWEADMWQACLELFKKAGRDEQYALTQARLARILRHGEYDEATHAVTLWSPSK